MGHIVRTQVYPLVSQDFDNLYHAVKRTIDIRHKLFRGYRHRISPLGDAFVFTLLDSRIETLQSRAANVLEERLPRNTPLAQHQINRGKATIIAVRSPLRGRARHTDGSGQRRGKHKPRGGDVAGAAEHEQTQGKPPTCAHRTVFPCRGDLCRLSTPPESLAGQWWSIPYLRLRLYSKKSSRAASQAIWSHNSPASSPVGTEVITGPKKPRWPLIESVGTPKAFSRSMPS